MARISCNTDQVAKSVCKFLRLSTRLEARTNESKHACKCLKILARLELMVGEELCFACDWTGDSTGGRDYSSPVVVRTTEESNTNAIFPSERLDMCTTHNRP